MNLEIGILTCLGMATLAMALLTLRVFAAERRIKSLEEWRGVKTTARQWLRKPQVLDDLAASLKEEAEDWT